MRNAAALAVACVCVTAALAQTERDRGKASAQSVLERWGTEQKLNDAAMEPMSSAKPMTSVDGTRSFDSQVACAGSQQFLQLTLFPTASNDIGRFAVDLDANLDGAVDQHALIAGPFAAACVNGMVQCTAGTSTACRYFQWRMSGSAVGLSATRTDGQPVTQADLGGCYCFNSACGAGLLTRNSQKVLDDMGTGIGVAVQEAQPRLSISRSQMVDAVTAQFFGQIGSCGADQRPEQYFQNTGALPAAGQAAAADPNSTYHKILASPLAQGHGANEPSCTVARRFTFAQSYRTDVVSASFSRDGSVQSCGDGCTRIVLGSSAGLSGDCGLQSETATITVHHPELITSARVVSTTWADYERIFVNGSKIWESSASWSGSGPKCIDHGPAGTATPNLDVTGAFTSVAAGGMLTAGISFTWHGTGRGIVNIDVHARQDCSIASEGIEDQCTAQENDHSCRLHEESVDGTVTVRGYSNTGASVPETTRTVGVDACQIPVTRPFFDKQRTYTCATAGSAYNVDDAVRRYNAVHGSLNTSTGAFTDTTKGSSGTWSNSSSAISTLPQDEVDGCVRMCKTRKPRPGTAMPEGGAVNDRNATGVAWDYTYRQCAVGNTCPTEAGEEIVEACDCRNNFGQAAAMMQLIRQTQQDALCTAP